MKPSPRETQFHGSCVGQPVLEVKAAQKARGDSTSIIRGQSSGGAQQDLREQSPRRPHRSTRHHTDLLVPCALPAPPQRHSAAAGHWGADVHDDDIIAGAESPLRRSRSQVLNRVILLIGLAVGVDCAAVLLTPRCARSAPAGPEQGRGDRGGSPPPGVQAMFVSGITVMMAVAGMYFAGAATFTLQLGHRRSVVVAVAMFGRCFPLLWICFPPPRVSRGEGDPGLGPVRLTTVARVAIIAGVVDRVLRRPLLSSASLATGLLVARRCLPWVWTSAPGTPRPRCRGRASRPDVQPGDRGLPIEGLVADHRHEGR